MPDPQAKYQVTVNGEEPEGPKPFVLAPGDPCAPAALRAWAIAAEWYTNHGVVGGRVDEQYRAEVNELAAEYDRHRSDNGADPDFQG